MSRTCSSSCGRDSLADDLDFQLSTATRFHGIFQCLLILLARFSEARTPRIKHAAQVKSIA
jgi:hypothetical protein